MDVARAFGTLASRSQQLSAKLINIGKGLLIVILFVEMHFTDIDLKTCGVVFVSL